MYPLLLIHTSFIQKMVRKKKALKTSKNPGRRSFIVPSQIRLETLVHNCTDQNGLKNDPGNMTTKHKEGKFWY